MATTTRRRRWSPPPAHSLEVCQTTDCGFIPLHGERDEESQFGVTIPFHGWSSTPTPSAPAPTISSTTTSSANPISFSRSPFERALIRGWEVTLRSPRIAHRAQLHLAYSNQIDRCWRRHHRRPHRLLHPRLWPARSRSAQHSQRRRRRYTPLASLTLPPTSTTAPDSPTRSPAALIPADYLPQHTTFDLSLGKSFR